MAGSLATAPQSVPLITGLLAEEAAIGYGVYRLGKSQPHGLPALSTPKPPTQSSKAEITVENSSAFESKTVYVDSRGNATIADAELPKNYRGENIIVPDGHIKSVRDPAFGDAPITQPGPFTSAQREEFLNGNSAGTKLSPHHRDQIPTTYGGVIDEIPGPGHPGGNQHTRGTPTRHPNPSIFNKMEGGNSQRNKEIRQHWEAKGDRLEQIDDDLWIDPGMQGAN